ncbi:MAG: bacteriochlorophyll 4-vinyl reductase [Pseudomonadota bacterium]
MSSPAAPAGLPTSEARIGPNAILQLVPVLDAHTGPELRQALLSEAGIVTLPDNSGLIPEAPAAALHQVMRRRLPHRAAEMAREAGLATGDYILAHRIPLRAQSVLRRLPGWAAAPILARAIARHAWTFAGSGRFSIERYRPLVFALQDNPVVRGEHSDTPLCHWHAAVFERLFQNLIWPQAHVQEVTCCAMGADACRFSIQP